MVLDKNLELIDKMIKTKTGKRNEMFGSARAEVIGDFGRLEPFDKGCKAPCKITGAFWRSINAVACLENSYRFEED